MRLKKFRIRRTPAGTITSIARSFSTSMLKASRSVARSNVEISGDFHRNVAVYHAVKNIARIIRRYSNWIYIHRDSRRSGLSATQGHSCTDKWVFQWVRGSGESRREDPSSRLERKERTKNERRMVKKETERGYYRFDRCRRIGREVATRSSLLTNFRCSDIAR